jgi:uncharacterized protein YlxW (UPF0749 family)
MPQYKINIPVSIQSLNDDSYWSDPEFLTVIVSAGNPTEALHGTAESIQHLVRSDTEKFQKLEAEISRLKNFISDFRQDEVRKIEAQY